MYEFQALGQHANAIIWCSTSHSWQRSNENRYFHDSLGTRLACTGQVGARLVVKWALFVGHIAGIQWTLACIHIIPLLGRYNNLSITRLPINLL